LPPKLIDSKFKIFTKIKRTVLTCVAALLAVSGVFAQKVFFPTREVTKALYANLNAKGKVSDYVL